MSPNFQEYVAEFPPLQHWVAWWVARKNMTFDPFRSPKLPAANQAEIGNASLNIRTAGKNQYLVNSLERDITVQVSVKTGSSFLLVPCKHYKSDLLADSPGQKALVLHQPDQQGEKGQGSFPSNDQGQRKKEANEECRSLWVSAEQHHCHEY